MKIKVESDVFDIVERIKDVDENYYILFNMDNGFFELHNSNQPNTYCLTIPYSELDSRILDLIFVTSVGNIDKKFDDIDKNNKNTEQQCVENVKNICSDKVCDIYNFSNNSSKIFEIDKAFSIGWR